MKFHGKFSRKDRKRLRDAAGAGDWEFWRYGDEINIRVPGGGNSRLRAFSVDNAVMEIERYFDWRDSSWRR